MSDRKHILVIGAAGAVGSAVSRLLHEGGYRVTGTFREADIADPAELPPLDDTLTLDMSCAEDVRTCLDAFCEQAGQLDGVAICTGIADAGPLEVTPLAVARRTFEVNTLSVLAVYQSVMPRLRQSRGVLAIVGSISGIMAIPFLGAYSTSKFALEGLADVMRREAYPWGVHIGIVEPGTIRTSMTVNQLAATRALFETLSAEHRALYHGMFDSFTRRVEDRLPGALDPIEVAQAIVGMLGGNGVTRLALGTGAADSVQLARSGNDLAIDDQFREAFGGSLGKVSAP